MHSNAFDCTIPATHALKNLVKKWTKNVIHYSIYYRYYHDFTFSFIPLILLYSFIRTCYMHSVGQQQHKHRAGVQDCLSNWFIFYKLFSRNYCLFSWCLVHSSAALLWSIIFRSLSPKYASRQDSKFEFSKIQQFCRSITLFQKLHQFLLVITNSLFWNCILTFKVW